MIRLRRGPLPSYALLALLLISLGLTLLYPIWLTVQGGFEKTSGDGYTFHHVAAVFQDRVLLEGLGNAFGIAIGTTLLSLLLALPLAVINARFEFPGKKIFASLVLIPLILPPFVGAIGLSHLLGRTGALNVLLLNLGLIDEGYDILGTGGFWAVILVEALHLYPILYLNATAALANLDPALEEAAENLGASRSRRFFNVILPLIRPGLFAGATIVFIWSFTELGTPLMFDFQTVTPVQIFNGIKEMASSRQPYALTAVMLVAAIMCYALGKLVFGGKAYAMYSKASVQSQTAKLRGFRGMFAALAFTIVIGLAVLPHIGVVLTSLSTNAGWYQTLVPESFTTEHYANALTHPMAAGSIRNSLMYASLAVLVDIGLGLLIGYIIVRTRIFGRSLLDSLSMLPLAVPGLVMAFGYVAMTLRWPFSGTAPAWMAPLESLLPSSWWASFSDAPLASWANVIGNDPNPMLLLVVAYAVRRLPYVVRATVAGLEQTSGELEEAAMNLGASRVRAVRTVIIPLIMANLIAGGLLAFSFAMLEVSDSLILAQREEHYPMTKAIFSLFQRLGDGKYIASAMGVWGMALLAVSLIGASMMMGKKMGAIFRV